MFFKKTKISFFFFLLSLFIIPINIIAYSPNLIVGGKNIGIELSSKGIIVVGLYDVNGMSPGRDAGLKIGDIITEINDNNCSTINEMVERINASLTDDKIKIKYLRDDILKETTLKLYKDEFNTYKTGLYVKDSITGIGTLTFIDPESKKFGALGHEIIERSTGKILEIKDGKIYDSTVISINKSVNGSPGDKNAKIDTNVINGTINKNTNKGLFGNYTGDVSYDKLYKVALPSDIKLGNAKVLTVIKDDDIISFDINITNVNANQSIKNIVFDITDQNLLNETNGIVQGMSGSPIIQDDYIIGAVTHVVLDNPTKGYGILITNMLEEMEK